ncbi:MAG: DEAD/DEAH box helicase [Nitrospirota bacterium]|nr:DEAD/DEAH box helicase [Nitrospirota bacterium]
MILRPRQEEMVDCSVQALHRHGNTLAVAPTGSGKTIMLSAVVGRTLTEPDMRACILAHRDELTAQNREKFGRVNPHIPTSVFNAREKSWDGQATFAMVQTLSREANLERMPRFDLLVVDEAHHVAADSYRRVIGRVRDNNPDAKVYGVTATPQRGDGRALREVFNNVADQITLGELIGAGHLVKPRTFVIDVGAQEQLKQVRRRVADFDMDEVAAVMNRAPINEAVVHHWRKHAGDRKTIVFCSTVAHAAAVCDTFLNAGIEAVLIHGELSTADRRERLAAYEQGDAQVVVNVAVLTEGYDYTPTACIVLLRPSSYKSTLIQMVGRGLRTVDPNEHPGVVKTDCIVLDFGTATLMHGSLEQDVDLGGKLDGDGSESDSTAPVKLCPECDAEVPIACRECPLCGFTFEKNSETSGLVDFVMTEIDLLGRSNFRWVDLFGRDDALMAAGFSAWAGVFFLDGRWYAVGHGKAPQLLAVGDRIVCLAAADDWLNNHESVDAAHKSRRWLNQPPTQRQLEFLPAECRANFGMTRYEASCRLSFEFNKHAIRTVVMAAGDRAMVTA